MILDFLQTQIVNFAIHSVGNKLRDEGVHLSKSQSRVYNADDQAALLKFFTSEIKSPEFYHFADRASIENNPVYRLCKSMFYHKLDFMDFSAQIAQLLYDQTNHPKISGGELYVAYLNNVNYFGENINAIGIFKTESKSVFMKVEKMPGSDAYQYLLDEAIDLKAIDKACIILNTDEEDHYRICVHNKQGKPAEASYWKDDFLGIKPCADNYHKTHHFLTLAKSYIKDQMPQEFEIGITEQIDMLNKSVKFFKENDHFDYETFTEEVVNEPDIIQSFKKYKEDYEQKYEAPIGIEFVINPMAVKTQSKIFKSIIKLDSNFSIYMHGSKDMIETGFDEKRGLKFYKLYFREES
jgi:hypothetical protein